MALAPAIILIVLHLTTPSAADGSARATEQRLALYEQQLTRDPEDLRTGSLYRQQIIAVRGYDRSIKFLGALASRRGAGPNVYLTLALAYIDKVPDAGAIRQLYLGRDAMNALTRSLERNKASPSGIGDDVPLFIRGLVNLYYNTLLYKRTELGLADLEAARRLAPPQASWRPRIDTAIGDGYWRLGQRARAREIWRDALARFPEPAALEIGRAHV